MKAENVELFENMSVRRAVISLAAPTVLSQLITIIYNMTDTFFIGQTNDPAQVAAVNLCMPVFFFMIGIANLFGIGASSLISRCMGAGNTEGAKHAASFGIWAGIGVSLAYSLVVLFSHPVFLPAFGADAVTYGICTKYIFWTIELGALPTIMGMVFAHLVRSEGFAKQASFGMTMGGILNIILDPIFIFVFDFGVMGAAMATMLSNLSSMLYFVCLIWKRQGKTVIVFHPRYFTLKDRVPYEILLGGLPSALMSLMGTVSNITLNKLMVSYSNEALAGIGIAKKIDMLPFGVTTGISQGVLPLIGYNYSAKNMKRTKQIIKTTLCYSMAVAFFSSLLLFVGAYPIVKSFIGDPTTVEYGQYFQRALCLTGPFSAITLIIITVFQAIGKKVQPLLLSGLRKGGLDIPFMLVLNPIFGAKGIVWATPLADLSVTFISILLFIPCWKHYFNVTVQDGGKI